MKCICTNNFDVFSPMKYLKISHRFCAVRSSVCELNGVVMVSLNETADTPARSAYAANNHWPLLYEPSKLSTNISVMET